MRILATAGNIGSLHTDVRLHVPLEALARQAGWRVTWRSFHECTHADLRAADVLIVQRGASRRALRLEQAMQELGGAVVYEIDDLLTEIAPHISQHAAVIAALPWLQRCMARADVVTVSTARLRDAVVPWGRAVMLVPNYAFQDGDRPLPSAETDAPVHLLVASSDNLMAEDLIAALPGLLTDRCRLVAVGPPARMLEAAGLTVESHALLPRAKFLELARNLPNAVAVIPLEDSRFAACKSAIKWFDYAEAGIPTLASAVPPYADVIQDGVTGCLVPPGAEAWRRALLKAIGDPAWRETVRAAARAAVRREHMLSHSVQAWQSAVEMAASRARVRPTEAKGAWYLLRMAMADAVDDAAVVLRRYNRQRLDRRRKASL
jgi:hypothetical protein